MLSPKPITGLPPEWVFHAELAIPVDAVDMMCLSGVAVAMERAGYAKAVDDPATVLLFCLHVVADWYHETGQLEISNVPKEE